MLKKLLNMTVNFANIRHATLRTTDKLAKTRYILVYENVQKFIV